MLKTLTSVFITLVCGNILISSMKVPFFPLHFLLKSLLSRDFVFRSYTFLIFFLLQYQLLLHDSERICINFPSLAFFIYIWRYDVLSWGIDEIGWHEERKRQGLALLTDFLSFPFFQSYLRDIFALFIKNKQTKMIFWDFRKWVYSCCRRIWMKILKIGLSF